MRHIKIILKFKNGQEYITQSVPLDKFNSADKYGQVLKDAIENNYSVQIDNEQIVGKFKELHSMEFIFDDEA